MAARKVITVVPYNEDDIYAENGVHDKIQSMKREMSMLNSVDLNTIFSVDDFLIYYHFIVDMWEKRACSAIQAEHVNVMHNLANTGYDVFKYKTGDRDWDPELDPPPIDIIGIAYIAACKCTNMPFQTVDGLASQTTPKQQNKTNVFKTCDDTSIDPTNTAVSKNKNIQDQTTETSKSIPKSKKGNTTKKSPNKNNQKKSPRNHRQKERKL